MGIPKLRLGDMNLVDATGTHERETMRTGCLAAEVWRLSEVMDVKGTAVRRDFWPGGCMEKIVSHKWTSMVRAMAEREIEMGRTLGGWFGETMHAWQVAAWVQNDKVQLGKVRSRCEGQGSEMIEVQVLDREEEEVARAVRMHLTGRSHDRSPLRQVVWRFRTREAGRTRLIRADRLWPVTWVRTEGSTKTSVQSKGGTVWYVVDEVPEGLMHELYAEQHTMTDRPGGQVADSDRKIWSKHEGFDPTGGKVMVVQSSHRETTEWGKDRESKVRGECKYKMVTPEAYERLVMEKGGGENWPSIDIFSDGGADATASLKTNSS